MEPFEKWKSFSVEVAFCGCGFRGCPTKMCCVPCAGLAAQQRRDNGHWRDAGGPDIANRHHAVREARQVVRGKVGDRRPPVPGPAGGRRFDRPVAGLVRRTHRTPRSAGGKRNDRKWRTRSCKVRQQPLSRRDPRAGRQNLFHRRGPGRPGGRQRRDGDHVAQRAAH